jgi:hypothetical protein
MEVGTKPMPRIYQLILEDYERMTLIEMRDHHPKAYLRERAAALLKVEGGEPIHRVAQAGLLRQREWETVAGWVKGFAQKGLGCLYMQKGRGRKPAFPPSVSGGYAGGFGSSSGDLTS